MDAATSAYRRGRDLIAQARLDTEAFEEKYFGGSLNAFDRRRLLNDSFPAGTEIAEADIGLSNFLLYLDRQHGGIPPSANSETQSKYGQFFSKRYLKYGGLQTIAPLLHPNAEAVGAVLTLYLIESGSNISVGRTLDNACLEPSDVEGHRRITGLKARAQGKPIIVDLPDTSPAVLSIEWLTETGQAVRAKSGPDADRLFVARIDSRNQLLTSHWYTNHFKRFVACIDELRDLPLLPSMIRSTVLLEAALSNDGRLRLGLAFGQHSEHVGQGYQQKWPTRLLYDENIRRFNSEFETLVLSSIDESAKKLRLDAGEFERRLENLQNTGLGTFCKGRGVRPNRDGSRCQIDCWNECPNLVLLAEINAFAVLQLWQASLRAAQPDWERDRPERWDEVWLPWLCFTDVVEEKASRGPLLKIWRAAQKRAAEMTADQGYVPPRPW